MRYATRVDVDLVIQILHAVKEKQAGNYSEKSLVPAINRVIFELEDLKIEQ